jgi:tetratricopeptide (TPR) repeat protein
LFLLFFGCGIAFAQNYASMSTAELTEELKKYPPGSADYYNARGLLYLGNNSYQEAINDFTVAIELEPENISYYLNRGEAYVNIVKTDKTASEKAINDFTVCIDDYYKTPKPASEVLTSAYYLRASAYYSQKKFIEAFEDTNTLLGISPDHIGAYMIRPKIYMNFFNSPDDALRDMDKCLSIMPEYMPAYITAKIYGDRADAYFMKGEHDKAIESVTKGISLDPSAFLYYRRGLIYKSWQRYAEAVNDFSISIKKNPEEGVIYNLRGSVYLTMAQEETDFSRKAEYQRKAEEDSAMYTRLTGKTVEWKK